MSSPSTAGGDIRLNRVENQHKRALEHPPFVEFEVIEGGGDEGVLRHAQGREEGLLPEGSPALDSSEDVDEDEGEDALDGSRDQAERQGLGMVLVPGLHIKGQEGWMQQDAISRRCGPDPRGALPAPRTPAVFHPIPRFCDAAKMRVPSAVFTASMLLSKSSPSGPLWWVRRLPATD